MHKLVSLTCQNPECGKEFQGRKQKNYVSKFCGNNCSARHRVLFPELYPNRHTFKKTLKVGHTKIKKEKTTKSGVVVKYRHVIVENDKGELVYVRNDKHVWEKENGPTPDGHSIYHIDEDRLNDDIENLECIPTGEAISRYSKFKEKMPIGHMKIVRTTNKKERWYINIGDGTGNTNYVRNDKYIWELLNGPVKKGYVIIHSDGDNLNDNIRNLECLKKKEALARIHAIRIKKLVGKTIIVKKKLKNGFRKYRHINIGDENGVRYIRNDKYVWLQENGEIPKEHTIYHKDGNSLNDNIKNLECIPKSLAFSRYRNLREFDYDLTNPAHIEKIVEGCSKGNRKVQKKLYDMMYEKCMRVAMRYSNRENAKDILADAFMKVFKNIKNVDSSRKNMEGWIIRAVVHTGIDYTRKHNHMNFLTDSIDDQFGDDENSDYIFNKISEEENFSEKIDSEYIMELIQDLSPAYKLVFNLSVVEGLQHKEIAEKLGISEGTSKSNLSKAKKNLQEKILNRYRNDEEKIVFLENYYKTEEVSYV